MPDTDTQTVPVTKQALDLLENRLKEIAPMRDEANEIEQMLANLSNKNGSTPAPVAPAAEKPSAAPRAPRKAPAATQVKAASDLTGRPLALFKIVQEHPGIKIADAAKMMGLDQPNYAYRVKNGLEKAGLIRKEGDGFVAVS